MDNPDDICPNCGEQGPHWVEPPDLLGMEGFWTCPKLYGADGRRLPESGQSVAGMKEGV